MVADEFEIGLLASSVPHAQERWSELMAIDAEHTDHLLLCNLVAGNMFLRTNS